MVDNMPYHKIEEQDMWRISMLKELMDSKQGYRLAPEGWSVEDLENIKYAPSRRYSFSLPHLL
jgi:hypothetical protein